jgi:predicted site-specific integrase-resolvase
MKSSNSSERVPLISRRQVAARMGVCIKTIARLEKAGRLRAFKINARLTRYEQSDVEKVIAESA